MDSIDTINRKLKNNFLYVLWIFMGVPFIASIIIIINTYFYKLTHNFLFIYFGIFIGLTFERFVYCYWYPKKELKNSTIWGIIIPAALLSILVIEIFNMLLKITELQNILFILYLIMFAIPVIRYGDIFLGVNKES